MNKLKQHFKNLISDKDSLSFFIHGVLMEITLFVGLALSINCNVPILNIAILIIFIIIGVAIMASMLK